MVNLKPYKTEYPMVPLKVHYPNALQKHAIEADEKFYERSDIDYRKRHKGIVSAEKALEAQVAKDWRGESEFLPQMQAELTRAGLTSSLNNFGDTMSSEGVTGHTFAPGSAGEANVARELGINILGFQDRNRQNRQNSLTLAENLMPRRTFGFDGSGQTLLEMMNTNNQNAWNQAWFADKRNQEQFKWQVNQQNAQAQVAQGNADAAADAQEEQSMIQGGAAIASAAIMLLALCWVARLVYGENPNWRVFRKWMLDNCPDWLTGAYARKGQDLASWMAGKRLLCYVIRLLMNGCTFRLRRSWKHV